MQTNCILKNVNLENSMLGSYVQLEQTPNQLSLSDYSTSGI